MTTSVLNYAETLPGRATSARTANRPPAHPFSRLAHVLVQTMKMMQSLPDNGRISARQLAKVRAMAERI